MSSQVPQVPSCIAAPQTSKWPISIRLKLHVSSFYVLEESSNAGLDVPGWYRIPRSLTCHQRELANKFGVVGNVWMEADKVFTYFLTASELLTAHIALVWLHLGVYAGAVAPQVVQVVGAVRALLTLVVYES